jgi:adenosylcobinamide-phosphate guanylyltransferase
MCGGRGTRLDADVEKPLFEVAGRPMVDHARAALAASSIETTYAVVSPHSPATREYLDGDLPLLDTAGEGYVPDLLEALDAVETPVLTVAADLPLLEAEVVNDVLARSEGSTSVRVPRALKEQLGVSVDSDGNDGDDGGDGSGSGGGADSYDGESGRADSAWVPTGLNVVADDADSVVRSYDARLAVNVNRRSDAAVAESLLTAIRADASEGEEVDDGP